MPGERYHSALVETPVGLERRDYAEDAWTGPPEHTVGHWLSRLPDESKPVKRELSTDELLEYFDSLEFERSADSGQVERLRYVVGLMLIRKRALKLHSIGREEGRETLLVRRPPSPAILEIRDPGLSQEEVAQVEAELAALITGCQMGAKAPAENLGLME